jgi:signal transduction histidine kinase
MRSLFSAAAAGGRPDGGDGMAWLAALSPRRHLSAAIGWSVLVVVALASLVAGNLAASQAERAERASTERLLTQFATQVDHGLRMSLRNRLSIVQATAAQIAVSGDKGAEAVRRHLDAVQAQFPEFAWLGVTDVHGRVMAATGGLLQGQDVSGRPWFVAARQGPTLGDVHQAVLLAGQLPRAPDGEPPRFVDAAAPITLADGRLAGVVSGHLAWGWIERLQSELLGALDSRRRVELVLADRAGTVVAGPPAWIGRGLQAVGDLGEAGAYIVGRHFAGAVEAPDLGWQVVVRQPAGQALAAVQRLRHTVFVTVLLAGLLAAALAVVVTHWLTRRLAALADDAVAVRRGERAGLSVPAGDDEVSRIGAALAELVGHLQREKAALATLNAELDARVVERTAHIERLAEESRHAAVTRERLRKLQGRLPAEEFDAELARAEAVAASGLAEARTAITQIRHGSVREQGLSSALGELLARFGERTGLDTRLQAHGSARDLADERAETLYRIVEESLRNVERHAQATAVAVEIEDLPPASGAADGGARARLTVRDDGRGFDPVPAVPGHYGLVGMREQAALIGAELVLRSAPGQGTAVELVFRP